MIVAGCAVFSCVMVLDLVKSLAVILGNSAIPVDRESDVIESDVIESDVIESEVIGSEVVVLGMIEPEVIESEVIGSEVIESELKAIFLVLRGLEGLVVFSMIVSDVVFFSAVVADCVIDFPITEEDRIKSLVGVKGSAVNSFAAVEDPVKSSLVVSGCPFAPSVIVENLVIESQTQSQRFYHRIK